MANFELSTYQKDILDFFINHPHENIYINALAGSGKSSTACMLTEHTKTSDVYVAFNKSIAEEFKTKIKNPKTKVYTLHGLSFMIMNNNLLDNQKVIVDNLKMYRIIGDKIFDYYKYKKFEYKSFLKENYIQLYNLCRLTYIDINKDEEILDLINEYNLFIDNGICKGEPIPNKKQICEWIRFMYIQDINSFETELIVDFTDMLYITLKKLNNGEWKVPYYLLFTNVIADEVQDFSIIQMFLLKYIKREQGRFVFVGDKNQAIYAFAGASSKSCELIKKIFAPVNEFELPINYRCPTSHLSLVRERFDIPIQPRPEAPDGEIFTINKTSIYKYIHSGDFVISRKNKWLSDVVLDLVKHGIPIYIEDKDMVTDICKTIERTKSLGIKDLNDKLQEKKKRFYDSINKVKKDDNIPDFDKESIIVDTSSSIDNIEFILNILESFIKYSKSNRTNDFESHIKKLLNTASSKDCVRLSSVHKAKGLESQNVFVLNEAKVCFDPRNSFDLNQQEKNLSYISLTRAKNTIYLVKESSVNKE